MNVNNEHGTFANPLELVRETLKHFRGYSNVVCFRQLIDLAKNYYEFDWSIEFIALSLMESDDFELKKQKEPLTGEVKWFVQDNSVSSFAQRGRKPLNKANSFQSPR